MIEGDVQLVDRVRPERVTHLGPVEGHPYRARVDSAVVSDVGEREALDGTPPLGVEDLRDHRPILADAGGRFDTFQDHDRHLATREGAVADAPVSIRDVAARAAAAGSNSKARSAAEAVL